MRRTIKKIKSGEVITGSVLSALAETAMKAENRAVGPGSSGIDFANYSALALSPGVSVCVVRAKYDIVPLDLPDANEAEASAYGGVGESRTDFNAVVQVWDEAEATWSDDMSREVLVAAKPGLPIPADSIVVVIYEPSLGRWYPMSSPEVAIVRISNATPNGDGLMEGYIQVFDSVTLSYSDGEQVWVKDANG